MLEQSRVERTTFCAPIPEAKRAKPSVCMYTRNGFIDVTSTYKRKSNLLPLIKRGRSTYLCQNENRRKKTKNENKKISSVLGVGKNRQTPISRSTASSASTFSSSTDKRTLTFVQSAVFVLEFASTYSRLWCRCHGQMLAAWWSIWCFSARSAAKGVWIASDLAAKCMCAA